MYRETVDYIRSLYPHYEVVPLHAPCFAGNEKEYLNECVDSTYVSSVGRFVDRLEEEAARYTGAKYAVACVNGTAALHLALLLAGVERGDEVITQPLTFVATCNAISYRGAHPVFTDVDRDTLGLSPAKLREWLRDNAEMWSDACYNRETGRRIKACVPMHTFGHPAHIDELVELCEEYKLELIEDAAESLGSTYKGKHTGTFGKTGTLSFNGNKTITTGGGGMLLFNDELLAKKAKHLSTQAKVRHRWEFAHDEVGYNYRMPNINAALGCAQLEYIDRILASKRETAEKYKTFFEKNENIAFLEEPSGCKSNYWLNAVLLPDRQARDEFLQYTNDNGVMTRPAWRLMDKLPMFENCRAGDLTNARWLEERVVNIPSSARL